MTIISSVFIQLVLLLSVCIAFGAYTLPNLLKDIRAELIDVGESYKKVPTFLASSSNPEVVLMGSSLMLAPALHCDSAYIRKESSAQFGQEERASYAKGLYLEKLIKDRYGKSLEVFNFALPGCMMSDAFQLMQELKANDKTPKLVILGVAPRDCMNNQQAVPEETVLSVELKRFHDQHGKREKTAALNPLDNLKEKIDVGRKDLVLIRQLINTQIACVRDGGQNDLTRLPSKEKQPKEDKALQGNTNSLIATPTRQSIERSVSVYKKHYNPPSAKMANMYLDYLDKTVEFASRNKIPLVVVSMPITKLNKSLLSKEIYTLYQQRSKNAAAKFNVPYINIDSSSIYEPNDFRDTVHLNAAGGDKFYKELLTSLDKFSEAKASLLK